MMVGREHWSGDKNKKCVTDLYSHNASQAWAEGHLVVLGIHDLDVIAL